MTPSEREAFDALVKYAEMEDDMETLDPAEWCKKYNTTIPRRALREQCRLALEKAREVQGDTKHASEPEEGVGVSCRYCDDTLQFTCDDHSEVYKKWAMVGSDAVCLDCLVDREPREEVREGGE